jgi:splicing factor 45
MVGPGEVDNYLQGEIREECENFGKVEKCIVYEDKQENTPPGESVRIFVKFQSHVEAKKGKQLYIKVIPH